MIYHVLNGDALVDRFSALQLAGEMVVARECLIEGDLSGSNLPDFYEARAAYLQRTYKESGKDYHFDVLSEFEKLTAAPPRSEYNLWFGYDLFCFANMLFVLSLLEETRGAKNVFVVYPSHLSGDDVWKDFGSATEARLLSCYNNRIRASDEDLQLASRLWQAYKKGDLAELTQLSTTPAILFPYLEEVCRAHVQRFTPADGNGRPEQVVSEILDAGVHDFPSVFRAFAAREGIYGFGDAQLGRIYERVKAARGRSQ